MSCKKEKNENSRGSGKAKLKDQEILESIKQETSEKIPKKSKNIHERDFSCSIRPKGHTGNALNNKRTIDSVNQGNFCGIPLPIISKGNNVPSSESVRLINGNYNFNLKEEAIFMKQKKEDAKNFQKNNDSDNPICYSVKNNFNANIKKPQLSNNFSHSNSIEEVDKKSTNSHNKILQTIESQKIVKISNISTPKIFENLTTRISITYDEYLKEVNERDDLVLGITADQFKIVVEKNEALPKGNRLRRSHVKLPWKCTAENHEFIASYSKIKNIGQKCPKCQKTSYKNCLELVNTRPDLIIGMTPDQFKIAMEENDMLPRKERLRPSYVKLLWKCKAKGDTWSASYHNIKAGTKCPYCSTTASVTYENYLEVVKKRPDLIVELSEAEFNKIMADNNRLPENIRKTPSHVHNLKWKCKAEMHKFHASYSKIKNEGKECPECRKILYKNYLELVNARPDLIIYMTSDQFKIVMEENDMLPREEQLRPSRVRLPWKCKLKKHTWLAPYNNIKKGHGCPFCGEQAKVIGLSSHPIIEYYSLKFLIDLKKCQVKYEKSITQDRKFRPDLLINRNSNFRINIEQLQRIVWFPNKIRMVVVDITFGLNIIGILDKCYRQYQSEDRYLLIVMMLEQNGSNVEIIQKLIQEADDINKKDHIKVINFKEYLEFLGLRKKIDNFSSPSEAEKEIATRFRWVKKLALDSFESETEFKKLIKAGKRHSDLISKYK